MKQYNRSYYVQFTFSLCRSYKDPFMRDHYPKVVVRL